MTLDTYAHVLLDLQDDAIDAIRAMRYRNSA